MINNNLVFSKQFIRGVIAFGVLAILSIVYCLIHYSNRGFELSDETFYLYPSNYFTPESYTTSDFGLLNNLACFGHPTLLNLRIAKLIYQVIAVLFFTWNLFHYLNFKNILLDTKQKTLIAIVIVITSFGHYDYLPMTLSYNSWSLILMLICFGLIFKEFTKHSAVINLATSLLMGFICFSLLLTKLPNGLIAMGLYGIFNLFYIKKNVPIKIAGFLGGTVLAFFLILKNTNNLLALIENYRITIFDVKHTEADAYFKQIFKLLALMGHHKILSIIAIVVLLAIAIIGTKIFSAIRKNTTPKKNIYSYTILIIGLVLCLPFYKGNGHKTFNDFIAVTLLCINPFLFVYFNNSVSYKFSQFFKNDLNLLILTLILTPLLLMIGTNNAFYYTTSPTMVFAFAGVLVYLAQSKTNYIQYLSLFSFVSCLFLTSIFYFGAVKKPYKQGNLNNKNYPLSFNPILKGIYESREAFIDYTSVNCIMNNLNKEQKPFLTFFNFYGFTIINNTKIITDLPLSTQERNMELMEFLLNKVDVSNSKPMLLLPDTIIGNKNYQDLLHKHNIDLDKNYKLAYEYKFLSSKEKVCFYTSN